MISRTSIALLTGMIMFGIITKTEESTLAACISISCAFMLIGKIFNRIGRWLESVDDEIQTGDL